ncbi:MAG TPA: retroviral-like aspartic protease family protein [Sphingomicrobium sp.]|nr:retroviral-like aspartic protease family protein [Sphingomicrobium sp.]
MARRLFLGLALTLAAAIGGVGAAAQAPRIAKPRPAPPGAPLMAPLPPAFIDNALEIGGDDVNARKVSTRLTVEARVNGRGPYHFVVDSGADTSVVGLRIARALQLPLGTPVLLNDMTARSIVDRVKVAELTLGPSAIRDLELPALREEDVGGDGVIGIDALVHQRLMMDFEKRLIKVEDARRPYRALPGEIVVTARRRRGQLILTEVRASGLPLDAVIDTGSEITIGNSLLRDKLIRRGRNKFTTVTAIGVTGVPVELQLTTIRELELGPITLLDVPIAFADVPPFEVFGLAGEPALLLGTDLLEAFRRVSLDFRARKVRFQLRRCRESVSISTAPSASLTRLSTDAGAAVCGR